MPPRDPLADGGRTNLILIRRQHHKAAHDGRYTVILHRPGVVTVRRRRPGDPYYEIRTPAPPPPPAPRLDLPLLEGAAAPA